jgi:tetratricopeptide (TPR) repeat protein
MDPVSIYPLRRVLILVLTVLLPSIVAAQDHDMQQMDRSATPVGRVHFDNSCSPGVRGVIDQGVASVYSFWFPEARKLFETAVRRDPGCAVAYWGQAMADYEQIVGSGLPQGEQLRDGQQALAKANAAHNTTPREQSYVDAIAIIYDADSIPDHDARVRRFSAAMGAISRAYPADQEAAVIYAMSLLKSGMPADPDLVLAHKALTILNGVLKAEPENPGVIHFIIHATDNPRMAPLGLDAARRYAKIAPAAPHALHMPSHIFARLGLWSEDIDSNLSSKAAAEQPALLHTEAENRLHAMDFLQYAYLQTGQEDRAKAITDEAAEIRPGDFSPGIDRYYYIMESDFPTHLALETGDWSAAISLQPPAGADKLTRRAFYWAHAVAAGHLDNQQAAAQAQTRARGTFSPDELVSAETHHSAVWAEVRAWTMFAERDTDGAVAVLKPVADLQDKIGKGEVELPAREMIGDMLRIAGRPTEALAEYRQSLETDPGRFNMLLHAGKIAEQLGLQQEAAGYYRVLLRNAAQASPQYEQVLAKARAFLASADASTDQH